MTVSQDDLKNALIPAQKNINDFEPTPTGAEADLAVVKDAVARNTAEQLAQAFFPIIQQIASEVASTQVNSATSSQLQQLQNDINRIKLLLGIA